MESVSINICIRANIQTKGQKTHSDLLKQIQCFSKSNIWILVLSNKIIRSKIFW